VIPGGEALTEYHEYNLSGKMRLSANMSYKTSMEGRRHSISRDHQVWHPVISSPFTGDKWGSGLSVARLKTPPSSIRRMAC